MRKILPALLILLAAAFADPYGRVSAQDRPVLTFPTDGFGMMGTSNNTFSWYYVTADVYCTYILEIYLSPECTGTPAASRTVNGPNVFVNNITGLLPGINYYWRVRAVSASGPTAWSDVWRFRTSGTAPLHIFSTSNQYGKINPPGTMLMASGGTQTYTMTPAPGCYLKDLLIDNVSVGVQTVYTFSNVTTIRKIEAVFDAGTFTIAASASAHGTISPAGTTTAKYHTNVTYTFTPEAGYWVTGLTVDGQALPPANSYTFRNIEASHTISVTFGQSYFITTSVTGQGTINPAVSPVLAASGSDQAFTLMPAAGWHVAEFKADGIAVPGSAGSASYTFTNVQAHHTFDVTFSNTYPVTIAAGTHGQVSPSGTQQATAGGQVSIDITPDNGYGIQAITVNGTPQAVAVPFVITVNQALNILVTFSATNKYYVSSSGDNLNTGAADSPFRTFDRAIVQAQPGDSIIVGDGIFNEYFTITKPFLKIRGSASTIIPGILIVSDNIYVSSFKINPAHPLGAAPAGIFIPNGGQYSNISLDKITASGLQSVGLGLEMAGNVKVTNSDFSNNNNYGVRFRSCVNVTMTDVTVNNNALAGIYTYGTPGALKPVCSGFNFTRVTASGNSPQAPMAGFLLTDIINSTFKDIKAENNDQGIFLAAADHLKFDGFTLKNNRDYGVMITNFNAFMQTPAGSVSSISFTGSSNIIENSLWAVFIEGGINSIAAAVTNINFTGKTVLKSGPLSAPSLLTIQGAVTSSSFSGLDFTGSQASNLAVVNIGDLSATIKASGIKINNSVFRTMHGISLAGSLMAPVPTASNLDARNNVFAALTDTAHIKFLLTDKADNPLCGVIDYSGSTVGADPRIAVQSMPAAYTGATYFTDVNLEQKGTEYRYIKGKFTVGAGLKYKGYLSNGLMNDAKWSMAVSETSPGIVEFEGFGLLPINKDGKLFSMLIGVTAAAAGNSNITGSRADFTGNSTASEFAIIPSSITYTVPQGVVQDRGDVTLDKVVNMQDFYALLYHLGGTALLTAPEALSNADFSGDGTVNQTDLNQLYTFITGRTPQPAPSAGWAAIAFINPVISPEGSAVIPVGLKNTSDLKCAELTFTYDPALISFQAFSSAVKADGAVVHAYEVKPGTAKFNFQSATVLEGDINPGEIILRFRGSTVPIGSVIKTEVSLNGAAAAAGPVLKFGAEGLTAVRQENGKGMPEGFVLAQNYPNPFNPVTTISYEIAERSFVTVKVYNMMGQEIRTLAEGEKEPGSYFAVWNGETDGGLRAASGTYIYRMTAGKFSAARKMIFMK